MKPVPPAHLPSSSSYSWCSRDHPDEVQNIYYSPSNQHDKLEPIISLFPKTKKLHVVSWAYEDPDSRRPTTKESIPSILPLQKSEPPLLEHQQQKQQQQMFNHPKHSTQTTLHFFSFICFKVHIICRHSNKIIILFF